MTYGWIKTTDANSVNFTLEEPVLPKRSPGLKFALEFDLRYSLRDYYTKAEIKALEPHIQAALENQHSMVTDQDIALRIMNSLQDWEYYNA